MNITKDLVPSIAYQVRTQEGVLVDEAPVNQPLEYLHGHNNLVEGLEKALEGKAVGDVFEVRVKPEEGYGEYNDNMVQRVPKDVFMGVDELEVGMRFIADTDLGPLPVVITEVDGDEVVVDGNHMLAGQELLSLWKWLAFVKRQRKKSHTDTFTADTNTVAVVVGTIIITITMVAAAVTTTIITIITDTVAVVAVVITNFVISPLPACGRGGANRRFAEGEGDIQGFPSPLKISERNFKLSLSRKRARGNIPC